MHIRDHLDIIICPACGGDFAVAANQLTCNSCSRVYPIEEGIPQLFVHNDWDNAKTDVTSVIKSFYEETPFPNYEELESTADLMEKAQQGVFARLLNEQTPFNIRVLEAGCGTGQLSNFLATAAREVFGTDMCLNSLKLAQCLPRRSRRPYEARIASADDPGRSRSRSDSTSSWSMSAKAAPGGYWRSTSPCAFVALSAATSACEKGMFWSRLRRSVRPSVRSWTSGLQSTEKCSSSKPGH